jgi:hypothetical protein
VDQPWRIDDDGEACRVDVELPDFVAGDWVAVEAWLGVVLPRDYKDLVGDGPALMFDDELVVASPFSASNHLGRQIAYGSWSLAYLRQHHPDEFPVHLFPEPGGPLCWGSDGGGADYYWDTRPSDPDAWTVVVSGRAVGDGGVGELHGCGLRAYLDGLADGTIEAAALGGWPSPDPKFRRL